MYYYAPVCLYIQWLCFGLVIQCLRYFCWIMTNLQRHYLWFLCMCENVFSVLQITVCRVLHCENDIVLTANQDRWFALWVQGYANCGRIFIFVCKYNNHHHKRKYQLEYQLCGCSTYIWPQDGMTEQWSDCKAEDENSLYLKMSLMASLFTSIYV